MDTHRAHRNLTIREDLWVQAKERGLNVSRFLEQSLEKALNAEQARARSLVWIGHKPAELERAKILREFSKMCQIDLRLAESTTKLHRLYVSRYLAFCKQNGLELNESSIRDYLATVTKGYTNTVKSLRVFFKHYLKSQAAKTFRIPKPDRAPKKIPTKQELQKFFKALPDRRSKALFMFYASTGRRKAEILKLRTDDVDFKNRMLGPMDQTPTKKTWFSFFNEEAELSYKKYLKHSKHANGQLFEGASHIGQVFKRVSDRTGIRVTPKVLREWFCCEMGRLGVPDRYVDGFCGRVPQSVLARHYTDYSPERLGEIYKKAGLRVLE